MSHKTPATHSKLGVEILSGVRAWCKFFILCACIFCIFLAMEYVNYQAYSTPIGNQEIYAQVIAQYEKHNAKGMRYHVLKLKDSHGAVFFSTSREDIKDISFRFVRIYGKRLDCSFIQYLQSCFFMAYRISLLSERDYRDYIRDYIRSQHDLELKERGVNYEQNQSLAQLYQTLFIADFLPKQWRDLSNKLAIAHLIAISGFHLGILSFVIGGIFSLIYRAFHARLSYRNKYFDIACVVLVCMFLYLIVLDFSPSFLRSFVMAAAAFVVVASGIKLVSFRLLLCIVCVCIAFFPRLIFSIGFWLSVSGVFYIFLFVQYMQATHQKKQIRSSVLYRYVFVPIVFNCTLFFHMLPVVNLFFPYFTPLALVSIPLSIAFVVFFPLMLALHIMGFGALCDPLLVRALSLDIKSIEYFTPWWFGGIYLMLSLLAISFKRAYYALYILSIGFFVVLCIFYARSV